MYKDNRYYRLLAAVRHLGAEAYGTFSIFRTISWDEYMVNHRRDPFPKNSGTMEGYFTIPLQTVYLNYEINV
jgi:hypothetical protein